MSIEKKLLGTTPVSGAVDPEGVSFDGTGDYLSRTSDLSGNADGGIFTFSAWFYPTEENRVIYTSDGSGGVPTFKVLMDGNNLHVWGWTVSDSFILKGYTTSGNIRYNTFYHVNISVDLSNSSKRWLYINDVAPSVTWQVYSSGNIGFTSGRHGVAAFPTGGDKFGGRLAHVFLDYTYRNLSTVSNRRLFIDSDGKPSDTIPSSPILYLPMTDAATAGSNSGTGGDFTVNGVLDTAGRAPNQNNCSASKFDGSADYLSKSSFMTDSGVMTFSCVATLTDTIQTTCIPIAFGDGGGLSFHVEIRRRYLTFAGYTSSGSLLLNYRGTLSQLSYGSTHHYAFSCDLSDTGKCHFYLDGVNLSSTLSQDAYTNGVVDFSSTSYIQHSGSSSTIYGGVVGELYLNNTYTDLATDNPFWDSDANRPKPVRQVISETGTTPLIALPMRGDDAGNNLGSGGDFTVNSGPYTGARGGSEFWARSAKFDGSNENEYLSRSGLSGATDGKLFTFVVAFNPSSMSNYEYLVDTANYRVEVSVYTKIMVHLANASGSEIINISGSTTLTSGTQYIALISLDTADSTKTKIYLNGSAESVTTNTHTDDNIDYTDTTYTLGSYHGTYNHFNGTLATMYLSDSYIDFSQESNRNLFVDQLGYPKDLTPAIDAGTIASPLIYMKFDDTSSLGTNSGTGGDFTVNGAVNAGADVDPNA